MLTRKQRRLVALIKQRTTLQMPTVQRDLAESLGIRRESLNKLLRRTRHRLAAQGVNLEWPSRRTGGRASLTPLPDQAVA